MNEPTEKKLSYEDAGVSIEHGNELVKRLKKTVSSTHRKGVMGGLGGFGALFDLGSLNYKPWLIKLQTPSASIRHRWCWHQD